MEAQHQSKLEYWDETYPDYCRRLHRDWAARQKRAGEAAADSRELLREIIAGELRRNRSLEMYIKRCLGAPRVASRLENDVLYHSRAEQRHLHANQLPTGV